MLGEYTVVIKGLCESFKNYDVGKNNKLLEVLSLGNMGWKSFESAFRANVNLTTVLGGNTSNVENMEIMFFGATLVTPDTSGWDTSSVTKMVHMFRSATSATPDTSGWDTSRVRNMASMFERATSANPDVSGWDTSNVTNMGSMFLVATSAAPNTSSWDISKVTNMIRMFSGARSANPDVSDWDTSRVTDMREMFEGASLANPDTSDWDFVNVRQSISRIFSSTNLSVANYSNFLVSLNTNPPSSISSKVIDVSSLKYNSTATTARAALVTAGWTITDGGVVTK